MKQIFSVLAIMLIATSCLNPQGNLKVHESFDVKKKGGFLNLGLKNVTLSPKTYHATLKMKTDKKVNLEIEDVNGKDITLPIKSDNDMDIPNNGKFAIQHEKIGQPFDVTGVINTEYQSSEIFHGVESCTWTVNQTKCERVCTKEPLRCEQVCKDYSTTYQGHQDVTYHYETKTVNIALDLIRENSTSLVASFNGRDVDSKRVYDFVGTCR